ncbi:MAG: AI-2E family transporter [Oscillospiraceae bacterium]|nr:AI-2E family transporter [Oscillospiraceae bacterium]
MDRKTFHNLMVLISYAALLVLIVLRLNWVVILIHQILSALKPVLLGFAIAFVLSRPCAFFERSFSRLLPEKRSKASVGLSVLTSYLCLMLVVALIFTFILPQLYDSIVTLIDRIYANLPAMQEALNEVLRRLSLTGSDLSGMLPSLNDVVNGVVNTLTSTLPHLLSFTGNVVSKSVTLITALVLSVYMLAGRKRFSAQCGRLLQAYASPAVARTATQVAALTADTFTRFISGQLIEACILGSLCFIGMNLLGFQYAPLISVIIGISALIPVAGAYIGAILSALLLVMISPLQALGFLVFLVILQQLEGNLIYPRVVGNSIGLPGLWVLTAVTVGGGLFGLWGMLLSVPAASVCYTLLRQDVNARIRQ